MKLIATRPDGAQLFFTRTDVRTDAFGDITNIDMGHVLLNGVQYPESEIINIVKFNNDWAEVNG